MTGTTVSSVNTRAFATRDGRVRSDRVRAKGGQRKRESIWRLVREQALKHRSALIVVMVLNGIAGFAVALQNHRTKVSHR